MFSILITLYIIDSTKDTKHKYQCIVCQKVGTMCIGCMNGLEINKTGFPFAKNSILVNLKSFAQEFKHQSIIHYLNQSTISIFNPVTQINTNIILNKSSVICSDSIAFRMRVFTMGGVLVSSVYEVDFKTRTLKDKEPMLIKKFFHSLCINYGYIYSIGGFDGTHYFSDCEQYCVATNTWANLPMLITPRSGAAVFVFNHKHLYCFYGSNLNFVSTTERIDISAIDKWSSITVVNKPSERCYMHGIQINDTQVLIFGGFYNNSVKYNDSYLLNMIGNKIKCTNTVSLLCAGSFCYSMAPQIVQRAVYGIDSNRNIHIYKNGIWDLIK